MPVGDAHLHRALFPLPAHGVDERKSGSQEAVQPVEIVAVHVVKKTFELLGVLADTVVARVYLTLPPVQQRADPLAEFLRTALDLDCKQAFVLQAEQAGRASEEDTRADGICVCGRREQRDEWSKAAR